VEIKEKMELEVLLVLKGLLDIEDTTVREALLVNVAHLDSKDH
jgi:hypothetical protein